jgi:ribonuclease HII
MALLLNRSGKTLEAGCDESGRGCLAGPVFAAAVILDPEHIPPGINDSKKLTAAQRQELKDQIQTAALYWAVAQVEVPEIDKLNILWASVKCMHLALNKLEIKPEHILVDGNRFRNYEQVPHNCIVGGDAKYASIAAASILAKTYRDEYMMQLHGEYPEYGWNQNKGYATEIHREAIMRIGTCVHHRKSFQCYAQGVQLELFK